MKDYVIAFRPDIAERIGVNSALVLCQVFYLLDKSSLAYTDEEGRWIRKGHKELQQDHFQWMSVGSLRNQLRTLQELGLVACRRCNGDVCDYTLTAHGWLCFDALPDDRGTTKFSRPLPKISRGVSQKLVGSSLYNKEDTKEEERKEEIPPPLPPDIDMDLFKAIQDVCPDAGQSGIMESIKQLATRGWATVHDVERAWHYWQRYDWRWIRNGSRPWPSQIVETLERIAREGIPAKRNDEKVTDFKAEQAEWQAKEAASAVGSG